MKRTHLAATLAFTVLLVALSLSMSAYASDQEFDKAAAQIVPPDPSLSQEVKAFFGTTGKWKGSAPLGGSRGGFQGSYSFSLVIKSISETGAVVFSEQAGKTSDDVAATFLNKDGRLLLSVPGPKWRVDFYVVIGPPGIQLEGRTGSLIITLRQAE